MFLCKGWETAEGFRKNQGTPHPAREENKMPRSQTRTAIPLFGDRVSPHFGSSSRILVVVTENLPVLDQIVFDVEEAGPMRQARRLLALGVEQIVCGGIERRLKEWLINQGVRVVENQKGNVQVIIEELLGRGK